MLALLLQITKSGKTLIADRDLHFSINFLSLLSPITNEKLPFLHLEALREVLVIKYIYYGNKQQIIAYIYY